MQDSRYDLRRRNGFSLGKFWREYNGVVPVVTGVVSSVGLAAIAGIAEILATGKADMLYSGGLPNLVRGVRELYLIGAHKAGEYLLPGFFAGQFVGYAAKMRIKPLLGLK